MKPTSHWRNVVEISCMSNNDEHVFYTDKPMSHTARIPDQVLSSIPDRGFGDDPWLVFSRPVYQEELDAGLVMQHGSVFSISDPGLSLAIDGIYKLHTFLNTNGRETLRAEVPHYIATHFYDCMSGGCPISSLVVCRLLIAKLNIDPELDVYPDGSLSDGTPKPWVKIKDFLSETERVMGDLPAGVMDLVLEVFPILKMPEERGPQKYRKKPVVIEAIQLRWDNWNEVCEFAGVGKLEDGKPVGCYIGQDGWPLSGENTSDQMGLIIPTLEGVMTARQGDYIIRGVKGELYPCKEDIFLATYEPITLIPE